MFYGYYYYQDYENENDIDYAFCSKKCYTELGFTDDAINIATCEPNYCEYCQNCGVKVVSGAECLPDNPCDFSGYQEVNSPQEIEDFIEDGGGGECGGCQITLQTTDPNCCNACGDNGLINEFCDPCWNEHQVVVGDEFVCKLDRTKPDEMESKAREHMLNMARGRWHLDSDAKKARRTDA